MAISNPGIQPKYTIKIIRLYSYHNLCYMFYDYDNLCITKIFIKKDFLKKMTQSSIEF